MRALKWEAGNAPRQRRIKLNTTQLYDGNPVRIGSFKLAMP